MEHILETVIEVIVPVLELMGLFIVAEAALENFLRYLYCLFTRRKPHVKGALARGMMLGLEFMMVAEILGGVVVIRAILAVELGHEEKEEKEEDREEQGEARE